MDVTNDSSLFNDSDLRLSTSLCQWAGFELDNETQETMLKDHSVDQTTPAANKQSNDVGTTPPVSPIHVGEKADEMLEVVREFLLEKTSQFYNDIVDAQSEQLEKTAFSVDRLRERYETLRRQTTSVLGRYRTSGIEEELNSRLKSIDAALRQLSIMKTPAAATLSVSSTDSGRSSIDELGVTNPKNHWRHWIKSIEAKFSGLLQKIDWRNREQLEQRLKLQEALQRQIEQEGSHWVAAVQKYIDTDIPPSTLSSHRRQVVSESVKLRWHGLWLKSLECQYRFERQIRALLQGVTDSGKEDIDFGEPLAKRRRLSNELQSAVTDEEGGEKTLDAITDDVRSDDLCSAISDTIPFSENEYEPLTSRSVPTTHDEEPNSARDGGYSSGSSAVVTKSDIDQVEDERPRHLDAILKGQQSSADSSPCLERRNRIENSPIELFYTMTPSSPNECATTATSFSGHRLNKRPLPTRLSDDALFVYTQPFVAPPHELTDSLLVNVGDVVSEPLDNSNNDSINDLEEILNLLRQGQEQDTFESELKDLLLHRQGTVWVPLAHDEEAADERREKTPTAIVDTPPNTPSLVPPTMHMHRICSSGSLKRRHRDDSRRTVSNSFIGSCNLASASKMPAESPVVDDGRVSDLSSSWPPVSPSSKVEDRNSQDNSLLNNTSRSGRKFLRACRLRRSWSYGMQLDSNVGQNHRQFATALVARYGDSPSRPNTAVSNIDDSHGLSASGNSYHSIEVGSGVMGGGETMAEQEADDEAMVSVLGGNQPVWEWDDYKPPSHNENGSSHHLLLDDSVLTAFDDDYCVYLGHDSSPRDMDPTSAADSSTSSQFALTTRLPPVGTSNDSDTDEVCHAIRESQQELRSIHQALKDCGSLAGNDYIDFLSSCEYNISRMEVLIGSSAPILTNGSNDLDASVTNLLHDWRDLALALTRRMLESRPTPITGRSRSSEEEEQLVHSLQSELQRLAGSLQNIVAQGADRSPADGSANKTNVYRSLEETQETLDILTAVRRSLTAEKIRLDVMLQEYKNSVNLLSTRCETIGDEVAQLRLYFEYAYESCDNQHREIENLRQQWLHWLQSEELCRRQLAKLRSNALRFDFKAMQSELTYLDERISRVEMAFSELLSFLPTRPSSTSASAAACIDVCALDELKRRTEMLRQDFDLLKAKVQLEEEETASDEAKSKKVAVTRRKRCYKSTTVEDENESNEREKPTPQERKRRTSLRRLLFRYWPVQVCLCVLICLNVFVFYPTCCEHMNRYFWSLGSKLDYSNGPPPT